MLLGLVDRLLTDPNPNPDSKVNYFYIPDFYIFNINIIALMINLKMKVNYVEF